MKQTGEVAKCYIHECNKRAANAEEKLADTTLSEEDKTYWKEVRDQESNNARDAFNQGQENIASIQKNMTSVVVFIVLGTIGTVVGTRIPAKVK